jgi:N-acetylneuraminic acid mutarotase
VRESYMRFSPRIRDNRAKHINLIVTVLLAVAMTAAVVNAQTFQVDPLAPVQHNTWKLGEAMPTPRMGPFTGVVGGKVYVIGGENNTTVLAVNEVYDPATNTWLKDGAPLPTPRWVGASAVVNGTLYAIGGFSNTAALSVVEAYNPKTNKWATDLAPMPTAEDSISAVVYEGIIYVIGGDNSARQSVVYTYDPATNVWKTVSPLNVAKSLPAVGLIGSTIIAAGGVAFGDDGVTNENEGYSVATNSWTTLASMPTATEGACFEASNGLLYAAGGFGTGGAGDVLNILEAYSLKTNSWMTGLASMPDAVVNAGSADVAGVLYCFGGSNNGFPFQGTIYNYVQIYQP